MSEKTMVFEDVKSLTAREACRKWLNEGVHKSVIHWRLTYAYDLCQWQVDEIMKEIAL